ncbi:Putative nuclease [Frankliniella fusca]|uniref:Nuclease n=1 Tax=Frankliniella fusca TaxID=407009 RepID=A0AAE1I2H0_9NEOP|nr:Putative nuclease [Frankliniella fusca]
MSDTLVTWTSEEERRMLTRATLRRTGFPGVVGAIDACHIDIVTPQIEPHPYFNMQAKTFHRNAGSGVPEKPTVLQSTRKSSKVPYRFPASSGRWGIHSHKVLTPFRNNGNLNEDQINYNQRQGC